MHISNVHQREAFRHHSYVSLAATGVIAGFGTQGYTLALQPPGTPDRGEDANEQAVVSGAA